jgi:hypothetical protein
MAHDQCKYANFHNKQQTAKTAAGLLMAGVCDALIGMARPGLVWSGLGLFTDLPSKFNS